MNILLTLYVFISYLFKVLENENQLAFLSWYVADESNRKNFRQTSNE